jgi:hypothetical protein
MKKKSKKINNFFKNKNKLNASYKNKREKEDRHN